MPSNSNGCFSLKRKLSPEALPLTLRPLFSPLSVLFSLYEEKSELLILLNLDRELIFANNAGLEFFHKEKNITSTLGQCFAAVDDNVLAQLLSCDQNNGSFAGTITMKNGMVFDACLNSQTLFDPNNIRVGFIINGSLIPLQTSEPSFSLEALRNDDPFSVFEADAVCLAKSLFESSVVPAFLKDLKGYYIYCNKSFENFNEHNKDKIIGKTVFDIFKSDLAKLDKTHQKLALENRCLVSYDYREAEASNSQNNFSCFQYPIIDADGNVHALAGFIHTNGGGEASNDSCINYSYAMLNSLIDSFPDHIYFQNLNGFIQGANSSFCRWAGYACQQEMLGLQQEDIFDADVADLLIALDHDVSAYGAAMTIEAKIHDEHINDDYTWEIRKAPLFDNENKMVGLIGVNRNITDRKDVEARLIETTTFLQSSLDANPDLILFKDIHGTIINCNAAYEKIMGMDKIFIVGQTTDDFLPDNYNGPYKINLNEMLAQENEETVSGQHRHHEISFSHNGQEMFFEILRAPVISSNNEFFGTLEVARDISARKKNTAELKAARDAMVKSNVELSEALAKVQAYASMIEESSRAKSEFLTSMSHEIRTPLNGVLGINNLLMCTKLDEQQKRYVEMAKNSGEALLGLINDILDFSKIEAERMELESIQFSLQNVLEDVAEMLYHKAEEKNIELLYYLDPGTPYEVIGDMGRVRQIFVNLVANSIKFTEHGSIIVHGWLEQELETSYNFHFEVRDTGIGIPADKIPNLFTPFIQADLSTTRRFGGTGLGLSICHKLISMMGGDIHVSSEEGDGSAFEFNIILDKPQQHDDSLMLPKLSGHVLIVSPAQANHLSVLLVKSLGLEVSEANTIDEGLKLLAANNFIAILVDYALGTENCLNLANEIKILQISTPLLALVPPSVYQKEFQSLSEAGYRSALIKPLRLSSLANAIVGRLSLPEELLQHDPLAAVEESATGHHHVLLVEDSPVNQLVAQGLLKRMGYTSDVASNGLEALEALAKRHYDIILMDCQMPVMDGYEATRKIRRGDIGVLNAMVPIVAMTAHAMSGDREKCLNVGMDDYLTKPIFPRNLKEILERWLSNKKNTA